MKNNTIIIIITYNNADLINRQVQCIKKFCKDQFDIVIIDNSDKKDVIDAIQYYNSTLKCLYYKTQSAEKDSSKSHCFAANFAYNKYKDLYKYFAFLDHDLFPVMDFSVEKILDLLFNNSKIEQPLIDFSTNQEFELDTGGNLYKVIEKYNTEEFIFFNEQYSQNPYFNKSHYNFYSMINNEMFMHFINGSNWNNSEHQVERINSLLNILEEKVK